MIFPQSFDLSACSDFFKSILRNNSHSQPLLYLSGIHSTNLSLILDYIYQGEVQIYQEHLDSFIEVAQKLKIEGLVTRAEGTKKSENVKQEVYEDMNSSEGIFTAQHIEDIEYDEKEVLGVRRQERRVAVTVNDNSAAEETIQEHLGREDGGGYYCKVCNYSKKVKRDVVKHIETHIEGLSYSCSVCTKTFRSRNSLDKHKSVYHKF